MAEDDRAAKAARAKALLRRKHRFSKADSDASWISSLPRASPPPVRVSSDATSHQRVANGKEYSESHPTQTSNKKAEHLRKSTSELQEVETQLKADLSSSQQRVAQGEQERRRLESLLENERQTVSLLVSEKSNLAAEVHRLGEMETTPEVREYESLLADERKKTSGLTVQVAQLQSDHQAASHKLQLLVITEKDLKEKCKDQERQLQLANGSIAEFRTGFEDSQRRVKELEEQISSDDRVEQLEESLKNTHDRAEELEFRLSELRQLKATLKTDYDELEQQYQILQGNKSDLEQKNIDLQEKLSRTTQELVRVTSEKDTAFSEKSFLQTQVNNTENSVQELRGMLEQASSEIAVQTRQLQTLQNELRVATRRANEAEKVQKDLQLEGTMLMRSLDEMRPKIVELTSEKLNLTEKVESLQHSLHNSEAAIDKLKSSLDDACSQVDQTNEQWQMKWSQRDKEHDQALSVSSDIHKAHAESQHQLNEALQSLRNLESQRTTQHQELVDEIGCLDATNAAQREELSTLRKDLHAQQLAQKQQIELLDQATNEIRLLQAQLQANEEESEQLQRLQKSKNSHSLNDTFVDSLRQQHALDLSAAQSQIRALEDSVFNAEAKAHTLQKQVGLLEDQLKHSRTGRPFSPVPSRPASRNETDLRRSSFGSHQTTNRPPSSLSRVVTDHELSPETRQKRKTSLAMLKARIESEMAVQSPSRPLSPVYSLPSTRPATPTIDEVHHRPQFLDDSHVFWCSSCRGDLVIL
ncbi:hypothetical protein M378DRAFT_174842 [Amanita muscaria Koide BX008]|uniref:Uncharacterized protein n=1 Tax=Amanita muscaria (strain Koide BX008) TaxID=946122 RepID=A0A0C2XB19_AMAMK|nr:hypothetical protein M378DRAFT_174842 [Amanita muscaria Koide BX008]